MTLNNNEPSKQFRPNRRRAGTDTFPGQQSLDRVSYALLYAADRW